MTRPSAAPAPRASPAMAAGTVTLTPSRDGRLIPYALMALGGLVAAMFAGQPALAALAVPFALALALGLRRTGPVRVTGRVFLDAEQVLEGDPVTGRVELEWSGAFDVHVLLHRLRGVASAPPDARSWARPAASGAVELPIDLVAGQWGRHTLCEVWVRLEVPFGLVSWTGKVVAGPVLRVLPGSERLKRLLDPAESRAVWGMHRTRRLGDGHEFAELRPYAPGDRLRDLNWAATARHGRPFVNRHHPELAGEVVIAIDAFADGSTGSSEALGRAARAAWALASIHLRANDRVGLAGLGGRTRWLPPAGGRLAQYRLLETLLRIGGEAVEALPTTASQPGAVPPSALVLAITPLHDEVTLATLRAWRARGRSVAVILIDAGDLPDEAESPAEILARRVWRLELERRRRELTGIGIPVVSVAAGDPMGPVVRALRRARRAPAVRSGRR